MSKEPVERPTIESMREKRNEAMTAIVLHGLLLQRREGNASAIEYLKNNNVPAHVIDRVASGSMRLDDAFMLAALALEASE